MIINKDSDFPTVLNLLHDKWFDLDQLRADSDKRRISIRFEADSRKLALPTSGDSLFLCVNGAKGVSVQDVERIRYYNLNKLHYDPKSKRLTLITGIPLELGIDVDSLNLEVQEK